MLIGTVAAGYFILTAILQQRDLFPKTHDDNSYCLGMQMLARGRLWMPPHPLADFFGSFYILTRPVYCSIYFPGTALMFVPTVWLHLPTWTMPVLISGAAVGLLYLVITELVDGAAGALAVLVLVSLTWFRTYSVMLFSQAPMLLLGLLLFWAWLRWREQRRWGWSLAIGVLAGWAGITRPVDAVCFALPIGVAMLLELRPETRARAMRAVALVIAGAIPFLALQAIFNVGVTGSLLKTPYTYYLDQDQPGSTFGFHHVDPNRRPPSPLPQKQAYYDWCKTYLVRHQPGNFLNAWLFPQKLTGATRPSYLSMIVDTTLPARLLLPLAAVGLLGLRDRRRIALWATLPLFVLLYLFNPFFLEHYAIVVIPAVVLVLVLGAEQLAAAWPGFARPILTAGTALILATSVTGLWEVNRWISSPQQRVDDETFRSPVLRELNVTVPDAPDMHKPAVILFRYHAGDNFFEEPVYNSGVAWPDDAPIIRAHDLGLARDRQIVEYYAARHPAREFYLFDLHSSNPFQDLGSTDKPANILQKLQSLPPPEK